MLIFIISSGIVSTRRCFGINIIGHIGIVVNSKVSIKVIAGLNASINIRIDMCNSIDSNASTSMSIIISAAKTGR